MMCCLERLGTVLFLALALIGPAASMPTGNNMLPSDLILRSSPKAPEPELHETTMEDVNDRYNKVEATPRHLPDGFDSNPVNSDPVEEFYTALGSSNLTHIHESHRIVFGKVFSLEVPTLAAFAQDADEPQISDLDYFRFSEENLAASRVAEWYATWSVERQSDPEWSELGESGLFAKDYFNTYNYHCGLSFAVCMEKLSLSEIKHQWPGNKPLQRRVYFTSLKYTLLHDYTNVIQSSLRHTHITLIGLIPEIITTFTLQQNSKNLKDCEHARAAINQLVSISVSMMTTVIGGLSGNIAAGVLPLMKKQGEEITASVAETLVQGLADSVSQNALRDAATIGSMNSVKIAANSLLEDKNKGRATFSYDVISSVWTIVSSTADAIYSATKDNNIDNLLQIEGGMAHGLLCGAFEGDRADFNPQNRDKMSSFLSEFFHDFRKRVTSTYDNVYNGHISEPGEPTLMAMMMANRDWAGPNSILNDIKKAETMEENISYGITMDLVSKLMAMDYNYIKCKHDSKAQEYCAASFAGKSEHDRSIFCPRSDTDPTLICQAARWYYSPDHGHEISNPAIDKFETFNHNRFKLSRLGMLNAAYGNYEQYGNNAKLNWQEWAFGNFGGSGFRLPVCVSEYNKIADFVRTKEPGRQVTQHTEAWNYPGHCGDHRAELTRGFLDAAQAGIGSKIYQGHDYGKEQLSHALYRDTIPRNLRKMSPYTHYMALNQAGIKFPVRTDKKFPQNVPHNQHRFFVGIDEDFELVKEATWEMNEEDANRWFCSKGAHSIFHRQRSWADLSRTWVKRIENHKTQCKKWVKGDVEGRERIIRWRKNLKGDIVSQDV